MAKKKARLNQMAAIRNHLVEKGEITSLEAIKFYGCTRLSAKIFELRQCGWDIDSIQMEGSTRYGDLCRFVKYRFVSKPETKEVNK